MARARILVADDHTLIVDAFKKLLEPEFEVVATVSDGRALLRTAYESKPDVAIIDLGMPLLNGADAGQELKKLLPHIRLLVVTMNEDYELAAHALKHWASGFLLKKSAGTELIKAIREILKGNSYVTPRVAQRLLEEFVRDPRPDRERHLTPRQREILQLLAEGRTMKEVAAILNVATRTVAFHKYRIMEEFGLKTNSDLVKLAIREHIISPP
jgi:DNA-binding NarL/FixJ family response regulator